MDVLVLLLFPFEQCYLLEEGSLSLIKLVLLCLGVLLPVLEESLVVVLKLLDLRFFGQNYVL